MQDPSDIQNSEGASEEPSLRGALLPKTYEITSPHEVIECIFMARELKSRGHEDAARRWEEKVASWLQQVTVPP